MRLEYYYAAGQTLIPNVFIDKYMTEASGEFVKVYLCLLRMQGVTEITVSALADKLDLSERTVNRALAFLEKCHLLKLFYDEQGKMSGLRLLPGTEASEEQPQAAPAVVTESAKKAAPKSQVKQAETKLPAKPQPEAAQEEQPKKAQGKAGADSERRHYQPTEVSRLCEQDAEFNMLVSVVAPAYLERVLTHRDNELLTYLYHDLQLPVDVLEYCIEQCVERKREDRSRPQFMRYIEAVALSWHEEGVRNLEEARQAVRRFDERVEAQKEAAKAGQKAQPETYRSASPAEAAKKRAVSRSPKIQAAYGFSTERGDVDYNAVAWSRMWEEK